MAQSIPLEPRNPDAYPRIVACMDRFQALKSADDVISCAGWMLMAVQLRLNKRNVVGWEPLLTAVLRAIDLLPYPGPTLH